MAEYPRGTSVEVASADCQAAIEQAKGILMARHGIGPAAAGTRLRTAAKYARRPLEEIAQDVISDLLRRGRQTVTAPLLIPLGPLLCSSRTHRATEPRGVDEFSGGTA